MMIQEFGTSLSCLLKDKNMHPTSDDNPHVLLAVSGGIDSMCMAGLFDRLYYKNYAIATVNFSLRGEDSDSDEKLVERWAREHSVRFFSTSFDTIAYSKKMGISIQMAARDMRYLWFGELMEKHSFDYLAVAHNLNDSVETFFLNVLRGTGIQGLTGIKRVNGNTIRPLLGFTRDDIVKYVKEEDIPFRHDLTNFESHYSRNRLRNLVFPEFEEINPSFLRTIEKNMKNVACAADILGDLYIQKRALLFDEEKKGIKIWKLLAEKSPEYWLYMILDEYGFNSLQVEQIREALYGQPGKEFHSESYILLKDREYLLLYPKGRDVKESYTPVADIAGDEIEKERFVLEDGDKTAHIGGRQTHVITVALPIEGECIDIEIEGISLNLSVYSKPAGFKPVKKHSGKIEMTGDLFGTTESFHAVKHDCGYKDGSLMVDASKLAQELHIRKWIEGDRFMPLGMNGFKKISDYLIDIKMDRIKKMSQVVVLSNNEIIALAGQRVDDRFKIRPETSRILKISVGTTGV